MYLTESINLSLAFNVCTQDGSFYLKLLHYLKTSEVKKLNVVTRTGVYSFASFNAKLRKTDTETCSWRKYLSMLLKMGYTWPLFCLFSFFSHDKYSTNTINEKA